MAEIKRIKATGLSHYEVVLGRGLLFEVAKSLSSTAKKVMLVYPEGLEVSAAILADAIEESGRLVWKFPVADGENAKTDRWLALAWSSLGQAEFSRSDAIVSFGGGTVSDLAGFIAATWLRGIAVVHVPTTLLAIVDASIGGKTGINTKEGKNLAGAFHDPKAVIADLDTLETLPKVELGSGFAEIIKCGFIRDPAILELIEENVGEALDTESERFMELVERTIAVKVDVVSRDFREASLREILNYGHTLGHAVEQAEHFKMKHGQAVAIGMCFVSELARLSGRLSDEVADRHRSILKLVGLPTSYDAAKWNALFTAMQLDKKSRGGILRFIILEDLAKPTVLEAPTQELLFQAFQEIAS